MPAPSSCRRCSRSASATASTAQAALRGIAVGIELMCRLSLVAPKAVHKAGFHPTAVFGAMGAAAARRQALKLDEADRRCARHRRLDGVRHHRISRRGHLDQAHARRLGGAIRHARGAAGARRLLRTAHGVRGRARVLPRLRQHHDGQLRRADRRFRHALGDADARLQALSVRNHDASLYRLRAAARARAASSPTTSRTSSATWARAPCIACGSRSPPSRRRRTPMPPSSRTPYCIAAGFIRGNVGPERFHRGGGQGAASSRWRRRSATGSTRTIPIPTTSPATSARPCATAA